jgi:hypothetical protein
MVIKFKKEQLASNIDYNEWNKVYETEGCVIKQLEVESTYIQRHVLIFSNQSVIEVNKYRKVVLIGIPSNIINFSYLQFYFMNEYCPDFEVELKKGNYRKTLNDYTQNYTLKVK